ncbi:acetate--CoA ligase family protein [Roseomonas terrae]|uniref:Acetate--CoA ligase family protein n=1 Tax=Neoroseomonas terrae TaxID=424799 RepID=A0ABS5ECY3_9PROT|nr:acetate--CoA ligase family protein [Neoroseomonas terrae]MBR0648869.1 acetate--CoA ligase family protein [Neoroseomonas terrae]
MNAISDRAVLADAIFRPRAIALIGATADQTKNNARAQRVLKKNGYGGRILPINPKAAEIMGDTAYPDIRAAPGPVDHAFIMVPAAAVPDAIAGCVEKGVKVATLYSAGFAELGAEGRAAQDRIVAMAREGGLRLIGPNCLGLVNVTDGVPITNNAAVEAEALKPGWLSVVSQSGSIMGALLSRAMARNFTFAKLVSVGNESDIGAGEMAELMVEDAATRCVLMFLETLRDAPKLAAAARRAHALGKPIIVYKLGRSDVGRQIAVSHTGAMVGADELAATFFRENGILRVETLEALVELPRLVLGRTPPKGNRVAVLTGTGGGAAMVVDGVGLRGDGVVGPTPEMRARLAAQGVEVSDSPLIDLPMGGGKGQYTTVLKELVASDHCDAVVAVLGSTARLRPTQVNDNVLDVYDGSKPIAVFAAPQADEAIRICDEAGIAAFRTPETCADALHTFLNWRAPKPVENVPAAAWRGAAEKLYAVGAPRLDEAQACGVFEALGIEGPGSRIVATPAEAAGFTGPVAVKLLSPDILHKTDAGLVRLNVEGDAAIGATVAELLKIAAENFPKAEVKGVLVAPMHRGLAEVILGYRRDPEVGPVVMLGMGGVLAELKRSYCVRLAPVTEATAMEMIAALPELKLIQGFRNLPRGDVAALARAIRSISLLACLDGAAVQEAEINPLIIRAEGQGAVAVDGLIALG